MPDAAVLFTDGVAAPGLESATASLTSVRIPMETCHGRQRTGDRTG
ncbi:hypothetical protein DFO47_102418 [Arthrobacter sp. AG258]|nr:hypothetical protein DFO47_102418 [Arthrobacter sp. AG258]